MENKKIKIKSSFEIKALVVFSILFLGAIGGGWFYAMKLRQTVAASTAASKVDPGALIEIERIRNNIEAQIASGRSFFLLGSKNLFDRAKKDKADMMNSLADFEKKYSLPEIPPIVKKVEALEVQHDEIFEQAMKFREKQTESKIVGQFYQSKTSPIRAQINDHLDEIVKLHNTEFDRARAKAKEAAMEAQYQIPRGMIWFSGIVTILFFSVAALVLSALRERSRQIAERNRLYEEAQKAILSRDEVISAVATDLKEPLVSFYEIAKTANTENVLETRELLKSNADEMSLIVKNIQDQKTADMGHLTLRLDQLSIDEILEDARMMLEPIAKKNDIRLQFESVNPPVLAFFDRERVSRVLSQLIGNAVKFSPKHSKVVIKVRSDQQFVNISVVDSGPGISEKQQAGIFDHFWQAKKTAEQGAGVGLAVVKTIVEAHGGTVRVSSHAGAGCTFTFSLPRRRPVGANIRRPKAPIIRQVSRLTATEFNDGPSL